MFYENCDAFHLKKMYFR